MVYGYANEEGTLSKQCSRNRLYVQPGRKDDLHVAVLQFEAAQVYWQERGGFTREVNLLIRHFVGQEDLFPRRRASMAAPRTSSK